MLVEFKKKKAVPFKTLAPGDTFKGPDDDNIWLKSDTGGAVCLQNGMYSRWNELSEVIPVTAKVAVID